MLRILHTSDWHLGRHLYGNDRFNEFTAFLNWLTETINDKHIDVLIVAGDIFDTTTPAHHVQSLYHEFLSRLDTTCCRHSIIVGGNHDSPSLLGITKELLSKHAVHVVGGANCDDIHQEVVSLHDEQGALEALVCAVPYLRDGEVRKFAADMSDMSTVEEQVHVIAGIQHHYATLVEHAELLRAMHEHAADIPIIATGHLFASDGRVSTEDGVREIYVGNLNGIPADVFPDALAYVALGHLHSAQTVDGQERIRYCGSPIPMGFHETEHHKKVCIVDIDGNEQIVIEELDIPVFQQLKRIRGSLAEIETQLIAMTESKNSIWAEVIYVGQEIITDLREQIVNLTKDTNVSVLKIVDERVKEEQRLTYDCEINLDEIDPMKVMERALTLKQDVTDEQRNQISELFQEVWIQLLEQDVQA